MATGDINDISARLKAYTPRGWFGDWGSAPIVSAVLQGIASVFVVLYGLIAYVKLQTRISTATDNNLDLIANDFFGSTILRNGGQSDASFLLTIKQNLFAPKATRPAMISMLTNLTGRAPIIFEPNRPADFAAMGSTAAGGNAYMGVQTSMFVGPYRMGSMAVPYTCMITAYRPMAKGGLAGSAYTDEPTNTALNTPLSNSYTNSLNLVNSAASDAQIYAAIDATKPAGTICWVAISN